MKAIDSTVFLKSVETAFEKGVSNLTLETVFRELPEWNSLTSVMIVAEVYSDYSVQIASEELEACRKFSDLKSLIESKL